MKYKILNKILFLTQIELWRERFYLSFISCSPSLHKGNSDFAYKCVVISLFKATPNFWAERFFIFRIRKNFNRTVRWDFHNRRWMPTVGQVTNWALNFHFAKINFWFTRNLPVRKLTTRIDFEDKQNYCQKTHYTLFQWI